MHSNTSFIPDRKSLVLFVVFFLLSLIGIYYHEVWLDEAHHFLLARDSQSFLGLIYACRNEGHPILWNTLLFIITRFSSNVFYMQLLHVFISCIIVMLICKSNLSFIEKILVVFGFYVFYEYTVISRNYSLSVLFFFLCIYNYLHSKNNIILLATLLFFLANTHLFSLLLSFAITFAFILNERRSLRLQTKRTLLLASTILLVGWAISIYCVIPPGNYGIKFVHYDSSPYFSSVRLIKTLSVCLKGIFYVPDYTISGNYFENSLYFTSLNPGTFTSYFFSIIAILIPLYILKNKRFALTLFCSFLIIFMLCYFFLPLTNGSRYFGFFYIAFTGCYWIAKPTISKTGKVITGLIFALQFINGLFMYGLDLRYPFSESKNISKYITEIKQPQEQVLILNRVSRPAISAYSGEKYFGVENGEQLSYCLWTVNMSDSLLKLKLNSQLAQSKSSIIVCAGMPVNLVDTAKIKFLRSFKEGILRSENAEVYRYTK